MIAYAIFVGIFTSLIIALVLQLRTNSIPSYEKKHNIILNNVEKYEKTEKTEKSCELLRVDVNKINSHLLGDLFRSNIPFIVENAMNDWPATQKWNRTYFHSNFRDRIIKVDSESAIVQGGGTASPSMTLGTLLEHMVSCNVKFNDKCSDSFVFDTSILDAIPELDKDIMVLPIFESWDNTMTQKQRLAWHMLSLGPTNTGLSFHSHGKTWISVVKGQKAWYLYPPGMDLPLGLSSDLSSLEPVFQLRAVMQKYMNTAVAPITFYQSNFTWKYNTDKSAMYRPLHCIQQRGEIMYLPDLWLHMTVNEEETFAYGGQASLSPEQRFFLARRKLDQHPQDFETLRNAGLGLGHMTIMQWEKIKTSVQPIGTLLIVSDSSTLQSLADWTNDIWVTIYFDETASSSGSFVSASLLREMLQLIAQSGDSKWNVAILKKQSDWLASKARAQENVPLDCIRVTIDSKPILKSTIHYQPTHRKSVSEIQGDILQWIAATIHVYYLESGSVLSGTSKKIKDMLIETKQYLEMAKNIRPHRVESWRLLAEIVGSLGHKTEALQIIQDAVLHFDRIIYRERQLDVSKATTVSIFHQLATSLLSLNMGLEALPILERALKIEPNRATLLVDHVIANLMANKLSEAGQSINELEVRHRGHEEISRLQRMLENKNRIHSDHDNKKFSS